MRASEEGEARKESLHGRSRLYASIWTIVVWRWPRPVQVGRSGVGRGWRAVEAGRRVATTWCVCVSEGTEEREMGRGRQKRREMQQHYAYRGENDATLAAPALVQWCASAWASPRKVAAGAMPSTARIWLHDHDRTSQHPSDCMWANAPGWASTGPAR